MGGWMDKIFILSSGSLNFTSAIQKNTDNTEETITNRFIIFKWRKLFKTSSAALVGFRERTGSQQKSAFSHIFIPFLSKASTTCSLNVPHAFNLWLFLHK